jgi:hypothetical protein
MAGLKIAGGLSLIGAVVAEFGRRRAGKDDRPGLLAIFITGTRVKPASPPHAVRDIP